eukprot:Skav231620  [mRNA]  locus=scaffold1638:244935:245543:+ [translate_table: standard]
MDRNDLPMMFRVRSDGCTSRCRCQCAGKVNAGVWNDYTGGVLTASACGPMGADYQDHCVMAVGYNSTAPKPYWIVRNSWASTWGMAGYIYLEMEP